MKVLLIQVDGSLPNIALMKLAHFHRAQGDIVTLIQYRNRDLFDGDHDRVYASAIFAKSKERIKRIERDWPGAIIGGTGTNNPATIEQLIGLDRYERYDYADYPHFKDSIGFTKRGCRLSCKFCVVPAKEGKPVFANRIADVWRGDPYPRKLHILDNDFFGDETWREHITEIRDGGFRVCLSQGINVRMITDESARALASIEYRDTKFQRRRLYTAWDNLRDAEVFFAGIDRLEAAGIPSSNVRAYMLIGYDPHETWERIWHRFDQMVKRGIEPYPMVYGDPPRADLKCFQRWVITGLYRIVPWGDYERATKSEESVDAWRKCAA